MPKPSSPDPDFLFAEACLAGDAAALAELGAMLNGPVVSFIERAGAEVNLAKTIAEDLLAELVVGIQNRPPTLRQFTGQCALSTWLNRVAMNRWLDRRKIAARAKARELASQSIQSEPPPTVHPDDEPLVSLLRESIGAALRGLPPEDFVLFRLLATEGLRQTEVASMFDRERRSVAKKADRIAAKIRLAIMAGLRDRAPHLRLAWEDVVELCRAAATDVIPAD